MIPPEKLAAFLGSRSPGVPSRPPVPLPSADGVLYSKPNPDGTRKSCGNCYKWVTIGACVEVAGDIEPSMVCGYHVFGKPQPVVLMVDELRKMTGAEAGLIETPSGEGTSCDACRFYEPSERSHSEGLCEAVASSVDDNPPVVVDALGCCARWRPRGSF